MKREQKFHYNLRNNFLNDKFIVEIYLKNMPNQISNKKSLNDKP